MRIRALIVDGDPSARSEIRSLLDGSAVVQVIGEATTAGEAIELIRGIRYDIAFVNVEPLFTDGLEMAVELSDFEDCPEIIFTAAGDQFAAKAFEVGAADYLIKPISENRLICAIAKVQKNIRAEGGGSAASLGTARRQNRIPVKRGPKTYLLRPAEIFFIESQGENSIINSDKGRFVSSLRLKELETRLAPYAFFRSHRGFIVNLDYVVEVNTVCGLCVLKLRDGNSSEVPVSRRQTRQLKVLLGIV